MASNNTNQQAQAQAFWDFIRSMQTGPHMPPPPPPPPHEGHEQHPHGHPHGPPPPPPFDSEGHFPPPPFGPFGGMFGPGGHPFSRPGFWFENEDWEGGDRRRQRRSRPNMRQAGGEVPAGENSEDMVEVTDDDIDVEMDKDAEKDAEKRADDGNHSRTASPTRRGPEDGSRGPPGPHRHCGRGHGPRGEFGPRGEPFFGRGRGGRGGHGGRGGPQGMHRRHGFHGHGGPRGNFGHEGRSRGAPRAPFDMASLQQSLLSHPWAQAFRPYAEANGFGNLFAPVSGNGVDVRSTSQDSENFEPPVDVFSTAQSWVLHIALPGAKKSDIGVNWDADKGELSIAGVVHRPGDEEFLKTVLSSERRVGAFERIVKLPPGEESESDEFEVDSDGILAKLEDGVLIVTVPKLERLRSWTDVKKVDIL